jgi:hypothetical protein
MTIYTNPWPSRYLPKPAPSKSNGKVIIRDAATKTVKASYEAGKKLK